MAETGTAAHAWERHGAGGPPGVVFLARDLKVGGAERVFLDYVSHAKSVRPVVVLRRREGGLLGQLPDAVPVYDLADPVQPTLGQREVHIGPPARTGLTPGSLLQLVQECVRLRRIAVTTGCRTVSSFLMRSHIVALLTKRWLAPDLRVVLNIHEHMSESEAHLYPTAPDRLAMQWVTRRLFPLADRIVAVADSLRTDLIQTFGLSPDRIAVVHNPIAVRRIRRLANEEVPDFETDGDAALLVAVGRLVHLKGFDLLIRAVGRLVPSREIRLLLVGDGPERAALETLIRDLGLETRVRLLGMRSNPWKYMTRAAALVLPSRTEAFPNVIGEALALGVLVIAADCSAGIGEYLDGGRCGILVPPDDVAALAAAIARALDDPDLRRRLAANGHDRMEQLELRNIVERYEQILTAAGTV